MTRFHACLSETLRWEGGYSDHPADPGGPTMCGVIQRVYDGFRLSCGLPVRPVREINRTEIEAIYRRSYWDAVAGDALPPGIDLAVFDFGVNSGPPRAVRHLQRALGVADDGHIGPATIAAARAANPAEIVARIMQSRRTFLRQIPHAPHFLKGWLRRCDGVEQVAGMAALSAAGDSAVRSRPPADWAVGTVTTPAPAQDPDEQSRQQGRATTPPVETQKTGITETAGTIGGVSTAQVGVETAGAISKLNGTGKAWHFGDLLLTLAQSMTFWLGVTAIVGSAYVLLVRIAQKRSA